MLLYAKSIDVRVVARVITCLAVPLTHCLLALVAGYTCDAKAQDAGLKLSVLAAAGEGAVDEQEQHLFVLDEAGLRAFDIGSGSVVFTRERKAATTSGLARVNRTEGLHENGQLYAHWHGIGDDASALELQIRRVDDGEVVASMPTLKSRRGTYLRASADMRLACNAAFIITPEAGSKNVIQRIELDSTPQTVESRTVRNADMILSLDFAGSDPGAVAVVGAKRLRRRQECSLYLFDERLNEVDAVELPGFASAAVLDIIAPQSPLISVGSGLYWTVYGLHEGKLTRLTFGSHTPQPLVGFQGITCGCLSPDRRWLVTALHTQTPTVAVWSLERGSNSSLTAVPAYVEKLVPFPVDAIRFSKSGKYLVLCDLRHVAVYDFEEFSRTARTPASGAFPLQSRN
jgi:hypothetical protein